MDIKDAVQLWSAEGAQLYRLKWSSESYVSRDGENLIRHYHDEDEDKCFSQPFRPDWDDIQAVDWAQRTKHLFDE